MNTPTTTAWSLLPLTLALATAPAASAGPGDGARFAQPAAPTQGKGQAMAHADLDGDGRLETLVADSSTAKLLDVLPPGPGFEYATATAKALGFSPRRIVTGDFDLDGDADAVIGAAGALLWLAGNGDGTFAPEVTIVTSISVDCLAAADLDGDGDLDVIAGDTTSDSARVFLGGGSGGFGEGAPIALGADPLGVDVADIDGDGVPDFAVGVAAGVIATCRGLGNGAFAAPQFLSGDARDLRLVDIDGDLRPDMVVRNNAGFSGVGFRLHLQGMLFGPPQALFLPFQCLAMAVGDLDGDGDVDIAAARTEDQVVIQWNDGSATFPLATTHPIAAHPRRLDAVDVDGDGRLDLVALDAGEQLLVVTRGLDGAALDVPEASPVASQGLPQALTDMNGDGDPDLVLFNSNVVHVQAGGAGATFAAPVTTATETFPGISEWPVPGDFDGDGVPDLLTAHTGPTAGAYGFRVLRGVGALQYVSAVDVATPSDVSFVAAADMNGDGALDVVLTSTTNVEVFLGDGALGFSLAGRFAAGGQPIVRPVVGDTDGDGRADVALARTNGSVVVLHGQGGGVLGAPVTVASGNAIRAAVGDLDQDGRDDVVVAYSENAPQLLTVHRGEANGTFTHIDTLAIDPSDTPLDVLVVDATADGRNDVVVGAFYRTVIAPGAGDGTLTTPRFFHNAAGGVVAGDVDQDGLVDLVGVTAFSGAQNAIHASTQRPIGPWVIRQLGLAGTLGTPALEGLGDPAAGASITLRVLGAKPAAPVFLFLGGGELFAKTLGGVFYPTPDLLLGPFTADGFGQVQLTGPLPGTLPAGLSFAMQAWIQDAAGPFGYAATHGLQMITQ